MPNPFNLINPLTANPLMQDQGVEQAVGQFEQERGENSLAELGENPSPAMVNTAIGKLPEKFDPGFIFGFQANKMGKAEREQAFQTAINDTLENATGLGITARAGAKLSKEILEKMASEAEEIVVEGGAKALKEVGKDVTLYPSTILKHATNELRRTPAQMAELTAAIQKEGVKPGAIQMWRMPNGTLKLVEGHHTSTIANALDPTKKLTVKVMDAPAGQTMF